MTSFRFWLALWCAAEAKVRLAATRMLEPTTLKPALRLARQAEAEWRFQDAVACWTAVRDREPDYSPAHVGIARNLAEAGQIDAALTGLARALARNPTACDLSIEQCRLQLKSASFEAALRLSNAIVAAVPGRPEGYALQGLSLRGLTKYEASDAVFVAAQRCFPGHLGLAVDYAANADLRGDWPENLRRSQILRRDFGFAEVAHACWGAAFQRLGRFDEADAVLSAAMARFPADHNLAINHAYVADVRGDLDEALRRWSAIAARFGGNPRVRAGYADCRMRLELARIDHQEPASAVASLPRVSIATYDAGTRALAARFQSLGSNCELGFVQRRFGAEPISLLRWAGITFEKLITALDASFDGVGGEERTRLNINPANKEFYTTDTLYGLSMHTFIREEAGDAGLYQKMCRRLSFLRDRLLDDLRSGEPTFVFVTDEALADDAIHQLHRALRRHGPANLLAVRLALDGETPGEVKLLDEGLALGLMDRPGLRTTPHTISFDCWLQVMRAADALLPALATVA